MSRGKAVSDEIAEDRFAIGPWFLGSAAGDVARALAALFGGVTLLGACGGGVASARGGVAAAPNRHEFPLETRETATENPSFTGPDGRLIPHVIQTYVRAHLGTVLACYDRARKERPALTGKITVKYVIGEDGVPRDVVAENSTLPDQAVVDCALGMFRKLRYDPNHSGNMTIVYPLLLAPPAAGRKTDPFFDAHDGRYGFVYGVDSAELAAAAPPLAAPLPLALGGRIFSDAIRAVVRQSFAGISSCQEGGRKGAPKWAGTVVVRYVIGENGAVQAVDNEVPAGTDENVARCVFDVFRKLRYQESHGGNVNVIYTIKFGP